MWTNWAYWVNKQPGKLPNKLVFSIGVTPHCCFKLRNSIHASETKYSFSFLYTEFTLKEFRALDIDGKQNKGWWKWRPNLNVVFSHNIPFVPTFSCVGADPAALCLSCHSDANYSEQMGVFLAFFFNLKKNVRVLKTRNLIIFSEEGDKGEEKKNKTEQQYYY